MVEAGCSAPSTPITSSFWALKDISFELRRGDSVGILGRNGCGKSTLLQIVCGITRPTKGELWVKGRVAPMLALGSTFDLESTGRENVMIGGAVLGLKRPEISSKSNSIADFAGIGDSSISRSSTIRPACACASPSRSAPMSRPTS